MSEPVEAGPLGWSYFCPECGERHGCQRDLVDRLRADLAATQRAAADEILRRISEDEYGGRCEYHVIKFRDEMLAALSAGGGDPTREGDQR